MNLKSIICSSLILLSGLTVSAKVELEEGGVYRITNHYNTAMAMTGPAIIGNITVTTINEANPHQLWVAESNADRSGYYLRDIVTGTYMTSPIKKNNYWVTTFSKNPDPHTMSFIINDSIPNTSIQALGHSISSSYILQDGYAHANGGAGTMVICYGNLAPASRWSFTQIDLDKATIDAYKANWLKEEWHPLAIEPNKVYQFINSVSNNAMSATDGHGNINCVQPNQADKSQLWVTESAPNGSGFYLRSLATGDYMIAPLRTQAYWAAHTYLPADGSVMHIESLGENSDSYLIYPDGKENSQNYAHCNNSNQLYSWGKGDGKSLWRVNLIDTYDDASIAAERANWPDKYNCATEIEPNRVYQIVNAKYGDALIHNGTEAVCVAADSSDESQLWVVEAAEDGTGYILRNYRSGGALMSPLEISKPWSIVGTANPDPAKSVLHFELREYGFVFEPQSVLELTGNQKIYGFAHEAAGKKMVCWNTNEIPTYWHMNLMSDITEADVEAKRNTWDHVVQGNLENSLNLIFADKTCTQLNPEYASMSIQQLQQNSVYLDLPEVLRQMVMKVRTNDWSETDPMNSSIQWDSDHAKKFRVQMIEPYSECDRVSNMTRIQAYTNFNNITGILGDTGSTLYVMVDKGATEGSTLYLAQRTADDDVTVLNRYADGTELHEGLNVIPCLRDCAQIVVYYTVSTNQGRERIHPLSDYDDIKIHIEGGSINGFFNSVGDELYTPDTNEDWFYYRDRARNSRFCLISEHCMLYLHFDNASDENGNDHPGLKNLLTPEEYAAGNFDLNATMNAWDDMFVAEQLVMGLMSDDVIRAEKAAGRDWYDPLEGDEIAPSDYHLYFNNRLMGLSRTTGYMSATWYRTNYNISTLRSIIMEFPTMDLWGPAHEFGHMNQGPMNIAGTTEESNNVFSNIALFYRGDKTSRASLPSVQTDFFNKGYNFHQHDTWGTTRMWFQLWLYYHATGHNKKFYPRLYELLRDNPLQKSSTAHLNAKDDLLHFAKMCCIAAGEDLTDFFDSWGFFIPQDGYYIGDYTAYTSYLSEEEIEEWKAEVAQLAKENGWEKNTSIIFIDDRVGSTKPGYADWCSPADAGTMGALKDFAPGADTVSGDYEFVITGTTVTVSGATGGVGFIIYDENGKLIGFSNDTTFEVSPAAAEKISTGNVSFNVVTGENEEVEVIDVIHDGSLDAKAEIIAQLLDKADTVLAKADFSSRKVGYIKPELVTDLKNIRDDVKNTVDNNELNADNIVELYTDLNNEVIAAESIELTPENTIWIEPNGIYVFTYNKLKGERGIQPNADANAVIPVTNNVNMENKAQQWIFSPSDDAEGFYIKSISAYKYLRIPDTDETPLPLSDEPQKFIAEIHSPGFISLAADIAASHKAIHASNGNQIVRWTTGADASQWTIELIDNAERKAYLFALDDIIEHSESLLAQAGTIEVTGGIVAAFPGEHSTFVTSEMMLDLYNELQSAKAVRASDATNEQLTSATEQLTEKYQPLLDAMNRNSERLRDLIDQTRTIAAEIGTNNEEVTPLTLTVDHYSTNAEYTGQNAGDHLSSWQVLFDNNQNTYFHSNYDGNTTDGLDHYIQIELPEPTQEEETHMVLTYKTRNQSTNTYAPVEAVIEYSADGHTWTTAQELDDSVLPITHATTFESETFEVPAGTAHIRFTVISSRKSVTDSYNGVSNGHSFFAVSEFGLATHNVTSVPDTDSYPKSNEGDIIAALRQCRNSEIVLNAPNTSHSHYNQSYAALLPHYNTLLAIKESPSSTVSIDEISETDTTTPVIYTLQGLRLSRISSPGIYIINGKKVLIK